MIFEKVQPYKSEIKDCTVVVLMRNHEEYIFDCLHSIQQELLDLRVLCVDIASSDESFEKSKKLSMELKLKSTHVQFSRETKTLSTLKNLEQYISTKYIILISGDDAFGPNYGNALITLFKVNPGNSVFNFDSIITDQNLNPMSSRKPRWGKGIRHNKRKLSFSNPGTAPGAVIPWQLLTEQEAWKHPPDILIEDYWIWWQLVDIVPFLNCYESGALYRQHQNNISKASKNEDYAYSLGYVTAIPGIEAKNIYNRFLSAILIFRWIRHLNYLVWKNFVSGYLSAMRNQKLS
jgi:hypothetical protein